MEVIDWGAQPDFPDQARVYLGLLGQIPLLRAYMRPDDGELAPEELGRRIDDALVECIGFELQGLWMGLPGTEEFTSTMETIAAGIESHPALHAFAKRLWREEKSPLPSKTYLELAWRHVRSGDSQPPSVEEGRQVARVLRAPFMQPEVWEDNWDRQEFVSTHASRWLRTRDPEALEYYIPASEVSAIAWDTLRMICRQLVVRGEEDIPRELLLWSIRAEHGARPRPPEDTPPAHRHQKLGYMLRDNEIRHLVGLLTRVGMTQTAACEAVGKAIDYAPRTIVGICREPQLEIDDLRMEAMKHLEPSYYAFLYGPGSDSDLAVTLRSHLGPRY
jgi:hypothetical protein